MVHPETQYARSGDVHIAYQTVGRGPIDVVFVQGFISNLETQWEDPGLTHLFNRLASFARLIIFDKRGSGLSDRVSDMPNLETRMDDVRAVMDAAGSRQAVLMGASEGGPMSILFAATYPQRTRALVLYGAYAHFYSWVLSSEQVEAFVAAAETHWGDGSTLKSFCPNLVANDRFRAWWARFRTARDQSGRRDRLGSDEQPNRRSGRVVGGPCADVSHPPRSGCPRPGGGRTLSRAPHRRDQACGDPGVDHPIWVGDTDRVVDEIEEFLTGVRPVPELDRVLATVLCANLANAARHGSGRERSWLDQVRGFREQIAASLLQHRGREVGQQPDGTTAVFDGPVRALRCALAIRAAALESDIVLHAGVHTGEVEITGDDVGGAAIRVATRIASAARAGEVLVSTMVRDIVPGCGLNFTDAGCRLPDDDGPALLTLDGDGSRRPASDASALAMLTARERDILSILARGLTNAEIATERGISEHTVKRHVANILDKLDLANRAAAAAFAARQQPETAPAIGPAIRR